ncbi:MAG: zinc-ribbon domain-containing protein [Halobacteriales archaeon]|nr:zinc-ribbon domain-containing protein [Halobacteriales archaeon]
MRLRCPSCQTVFSAKVNARNVKCPSCGKREQAPWEGWEGAPGWRKGMVGSFTRVDERGQPRTAPASKVVPIAVAVLVVIAAAAAAWWWFGGSMPISARACPDVPNAAPTPPAPVEIDLITPGVWNVCGDTDYMFVWVHNNGTAPLNYTWSVGGAGGAALPAGWNATFEVPSGHLAPGDSKGADWQGTLVTLHIPAGAPGGVIPAELRAGGAVRAFDLHVASHRGSVVAVGTSLNTHYDLHGQDRQRVEEGNFCLKVGGTGAVTAYSFGTAGLALDETVTLVVPPAFAYGFDQARSELANQVLQWKTTAVSTTAACPNGP